MTRSNKKPSRQERFTASVRASAARDGVHFGRVLPEAKAKTVANKDHVNAFDSPGTPAKRRIHSRNGAEWKGGQFICGSQVDDDGDATAEIDDDPLQNQEEHHNAHPQPEMTVTIQEIIRPVKIKALRNQYEFVPRAADSVRHGLGEDEYDIVSTVCPSEGWEVICDESDRCTANGIT